MDKQNILATAQQVLVTEARTVQQLIDRIDERFFTACEYLFNCKGHVVVIGMGKSGHIANKIAATLASTGTPSFFVHPAEASHGDLGMIRTEDIVLAISNSGNTPEILAILPIIKYLGVKLISLTGNPNSALAQAANVNIDVSIEQEACPLGLAPTASTTATLAMGDALAIALLKNRDFTERDFALSHPGGMLGKKLLLRVSDLMHTDKDIPIVTQNDTIKHALFAITSKRLGMTTVVEDNKLVGIFTDGDLRRALDNGVDINSTKIKDAMTKTTKVVSPQILAIEALEIMEKYAITSLVAVDNNKVVGVVHLHDILKSGIIPIQV